MSLVFAHRSLQPERMDLETLEPAAAAHVLGNLETINHWLGGVRTTLWHLKRFSKSWKRGTTIRLLDWGTGGADLPRALVDWGRRSGWDFEIIGIDHDPIIAAYARKACQTYPEIQILQADARAYAAEPGSFDYVLSSLTLHHLSDEAIVDLLRRSDRLACKGLVMNDLRRSARAWAWIWILSRLGRAHSMVQHDGPLSVRRAFHPSELNDYAHQAGLSYLKTLTHFGYRLTLAGEKP